MHDKGDSLVDEWDSETSWDTCPVKELKVGRSR